MLQTDEIIDKDEVLKMAGKVYGTTDFHKSALFHLEAFAKLVADVATAKEREACAKVCDEMPTYVNRHNAVIESSATDCAAAIRARGETTLRGEA